MKMKLSGLGIVLAATGIAGYIFLVRHWYLRWGASEEEVRQVLPGDDEVTQPRYVATRALTIEASPSAIWPWLVQMGQGRGGLYSYDWLENLMGLDIHSADQIRPELQHLEIGDLVRLAPEQGARLALEVKQIEPMRALVLCTSGDQTAMMEAGYPHASWAFILHKLDEQRTRLIVRWRSDYKPTLLNALVNQILLEPIHFMMEQKMLRGIKQRVEQISTKSVGTLPRQMV